MRVYACVCTNTCISCTTNTLEYHIVYGRERERDHVCNISDELEFDMHAEHCNILMNTQIFIEIDIHKRDLCECPDINT